MRRIAIRWKSEDIVELITRRVLESRAVAAAFSLNREQLKSDSGRQQIYFTLLPAAVESSDSKGWIAEHTSDATGSLNPRNVVTLLRMARDAQMQQAERNDTDFSRIGSLLSARILKCLGAAFRSTP